MADPAHEIVLSVIVPVLNTRPYLPECLESLVRQTLGDIEIICIDNGSSDGSHELLQDYARRDDRVRALRHVGGRQGGARNAGLAVARGTYVGFVDSDDVADVAMFEKLVQKCREADADMGICNLGFFVAKVENAAAVVPKVWLDNEGGFRIEARPKLLRNLTICNKVFRRSFMAGHGIDFPEGVYHEDQLFVIKAAMLAERIVSVPDTLYYYRRHRTGSVNEYRGRDNLGIFEVMREVENFGQTAGPASGKAALLAELRVQRLLMLAHSSDAEHRKEYYRRMRAEFLRIELAEPTRILTPSEMREFRVIVHCGYGFYRWFIVLRRQYGWIRGWRGSAGQKSPRSPGWCDPGLRSPRIEPEA